MKKIKFAAQVIILAAAFPVLFVSGISHHNKKAEQPNMEIKNSLVVKKNRVTECICKVLEADQPVMPKVVLLNN